MYQGEIALGRFRIKNLHGLLIGFQFLRVKGNSLREQINETLLTWVQGVIQMRGDAKQEVYLVKFLSNSKWQSNLETRSHLLSIVKAHIKIIQTQISKIMVDSKILGLSRQSIISIKAN
jgi:hypothetical protein